MLHACTCIDLILLRPSTCLGLRRACLCALGLIHHRPFGCDVIDPENACAPWPLLPLCSVRLSLVAVLFRRPARFLLSCASLLAACSNVVFVRACCRGRHHLKPSSSLRETIRAYQQAVCSPLNMLVLVLNTSPIELTPASPMPPAEKRYRLPFPGSCGTHAAHLFQPKKRGKSEHTRAWLHLIRARDRRHGTNRADREHSLIRSFRAIALALRIWCSTCLVAIVPTTSLFKFVCSVPPVHVQRLVY